VVPFIPLEACVKDGRAGASFRRDACGGSATPGLFLRGRGAPSGSRESGKKSAGPFEGLRTVVPESGTKSDAPHAGANRRRCAKGVIAYTINLRPAMWALTGASRGRSDVVRRVPAVKAMGVPLAPAIRRKVTMNLTDFEVTPEAIAYLKPCKSERRGMVSKWTRARSSD